MYYGLFRQYFSVVFVHSGTDPHRYLINVFCPMLIAFVCVIGELELSGRKLLMWLAGFLVFMLLYRPVNYVFPLFSSELNVSAAVGHLLGYWRFPCGVKTHGHREFHWLYYLYIAECSISISVFVFRRIDLELSTFPAGYLEGDALPEKFLK